MSFDGMIPAGGVVEFSVWPLIRDDGGHDITIDGPDRWRRLVTGPIEGTDEPVVLDEKGLPSEYLDRVMMRDLQQTTALMCTSAMLMAQSVTRRASRGGRSDQSTDAMARRHRLSTST